MFFGDWLQRREMLSPNKVALIDAISDNQPITYREWNRQANQLANLLLDGRAICKSDRVSIYAMNRVEYLDALRARNKLGAILHYRCISANSVDTVVSWGLRPDDMVRQRIPFFHTRGLNVLTTPLVHIGGTSIICASFDIDRPFDQIEKLGVTFFFAVPTLFLTMIQHPRWKSLDLSNVRLVMAGGGACPAVVYEAFWEKGADFKSDYRLTEAGPNSFWLPTEEMKNKVGSVGRPLFDIDVKLVDEAAEEVGPDEAGHLLTRRPHVFGGYWNQPEAIAETIVDGWPHTGDLARRDEEADYYIVGRLKDMIKSGGENIYPAEVEDLMHSHPDMAEAALIPVPDAKWSEIGRASGRGQCLPVPGI